jgi:hypothetical protein
MFNTTLEATTLGTSVARRSNASCDSSSSNVPPAMFNTTLEATRLGTSVARRSNASFDSSSSNVPPAMFNTTLEATLDASVARRNNTSFDSSFSNVPPAMFNTTLEATLDASVAKSDTASNSSSSRRESCNPPSPPSIIATPQRLVANNDESQPLTSTDPESAPFDVGALRFWARQGAGVTFHSAPVDDNSDDEPSNDSSPTAGFM